MLVTTRRQIRCPKNLLLHHPALGILVLILNPKVEVAFKSQLTGTPEKSELNFEISWGEK